MNRKDEKKQKGGMNNIMWILIPLMVLIGFHIIMIIYLNIMNDWRGFSIDFDGLKSKYNPDYEGWFAYYILLPLNVMFRVLFKPYNNP
tara:strand:+ start:12 stop:275 length:264 start_codon:yes stop_codon:yes gene_type:complete